MLGKETSRACALMSVCDVARQRRGIVPPTRSAQPLRGVLDASQPRLREAVYLCTKSATGGVLYSKRATSWRTPRGPAPRPPPARHVCREDLAGGHESFGLTADLQSAPSCSACVSCGTSLPADPLDRPRWPSQGPRRRHASLKA